VKDVNTVFRKLDFWRHHELVWSGPGKRTRRHIYSEHRTVSGATKIFPQPNNYKYK